MREIALSKFGLLTVEEAAARRGCAVRTVQRWIEDGLIPCVPVGPAGRNRKYLVQVTDLDAFEPAPAGAPPGNQNAKKEKPTAKKKGGKK